MGRLDQAALLLLSAHLVILPRPLLGTTTATTTAAQVTAAPTGRVGVGCPPVLASCRCKGTSISCARVRLPPLPADVFRNRTNDTTTITLEDAGLASLPATLFHGLTALKHLDLRGNALTSLPAGLLAGLPSLETLRLNSNRFSTLPALGDIPRLKNLGFFGNAITSVPVGPLRGLPSLEYLFLDDNRITALEPGAFSGLHSLLFLILSGNRLTTLSANTFDGLGNLTELELDSNAISTVELGAFNGLPSLYSLLLGANRLSSLPATIFQGLSVTSLSLGLNSLTGLPPEVFRGLVRLTGLSLALNALESLDAGLFSGLTAMSDLSLESNNLTALPEGIFDGLANLTTLDLSTNDLETLPDGVFVNLTRLRDLDLSSNKLTALPVNVFAPLSFNALQNIVLSENGLNNATQLEFQLNELDTFRTTPTFFLGLAANPAFCTYRTSREQFVCRCSPLFDVQGDLCVPPAPVVRLQRSTPSGVIAGSVVGGLVGGLLLVALGEWLRQRVRGLRVELDLRQSLLESQEMENLELKRAWDIDPRDVDLGRRIDGDSPGTFGEVWYAEWDGLGVAVKRLRLAMAELDATAGREFETEVDLLRKCRHRNIVRFFGAGTWDEGRGLPFLVTEYLENGAMSTYLRAHGGEIGWAQKRRWCVEIQAGMEYIHGLGRIHRDLKTGNVLLSLRLRAKIADFGSMKDILVGGGGGGGAGGGGGGLAAMMAAGFGGDASTRTMTAGVGTPLYMAPEIMRGERYGPSADVWSLGVVVWEIATQERPDLTEYVGAEEGFNWSGPFMGRLEAALVAGHRLPVAGLPELLRPIVAACWGLAPLGRPSIGDVGEMLAGFAEASVV